jgi:hypothetical protein
MLCQIIILDAELLPLLIKSQSLTILGVLMRCNPFLQTTLEYCCIEGYFALKTEKCLDEKLEEVSDRILKKCARVPLAIITIASLLASKKRNKTEWDEVYNSIGNGMEISLDVENMREFVI